MIVIVCCVEWVCVLIGCVVVMVLSVLSNVVCSFY